MGRREGQTGYVKWPKPRRHLLDTGEGGLWVYAFWLCEYSEQVTQPVYVGLDILDESRLTSETVTYYDDPFIRCHGPDTVISLPLPDVVVSDNDEDVYPGELMIEQPTGKHVAWEQREEYVRYLADAGVTTLAAVCLGSSSLSLADRGRYWTCGFDDLTHRGRSLVRRLNRLYRRKARILTYLDT